MELIIIAGSFLMGAVCCVSATIVILKKRFQCRSKCMKDDCLCIEKKDENEHTDEKEARTVQFTRRATDVM